MGIGIIDNFNVNAKKPIDSRFGPYESPDEAKNSIDINTQRYQGLVVLVTGSSYLTDGRPTEYWFQNGINDNDLVIKPGGSSSTNPDPNLGPTPTLQQVTNQGASTTNNVEITGSLYIKGNENVQTFNPNSTTALEIDSIDGSTNDAILIRDNGFERARIGLAMGGKEGFISLQNDSGPSIQFRSDNGEPNFIKPKLHLGGSSVASEQLQVTGNAKITGSLIISGSIDMALKSGPAFTITEMDSYENSNKIFEVNASGAMDVNGSIRSNFTSCNFEYNNNQITEITKSFSTGNTEKTEITYTGENPSTINVIGTDGVSTLYTIEYNGNNISGVTVT